MIANGAAVTVELRVYTVVGEAVEGTATLPVTVVARGMPLVVVDTMSPLFSVTWPLIDAAEREFCEGLTV